jgi:spore coat protein A, manganese oxidase
MASKVTRRKFIGTGAAAGAAAAGAGMLLSPRSGVASPVEPQTLLPANQIPQFVTPLPTFVSQRLDEATYTVSIQEFQQKVLPESIYQGLKPPFNQGTYLWGHKNGRFQPSWPGHTVIAHRHTPTTVTYVNNLPLPGRSQLEPLLTMDQTLNWANPENLPPSTQPYQGVIPTVTHLHGNEVPSEFDGTSQEWFTQNGIHGKAYSTLVPTAANAAVYEYVNTQEPNGMMFHPHERGITRTQVYAGLVSHYWLRDQFDTGEADNPLGLPAGAFEIELTMQDREFDTNGQLLYPFSGGGDPNVHPFWLDSFFASVICVNGASWPFFEVEPRRYRFRMLNFANMRWFQLFLQNATTGAAGPPIWQIGTDGGLLDTPVKLSFNPNDNNIEGGTKLLLGTTERADVIIDFTGLEGQTINLLNSAPSPLAVLGTAPEDVFPDPTLDGRVMQFRVGNGTGPPDTTYNPASGKPLRGGRNQLEKIVRLANPTTGTVAPGVHIDLKRQLTFLEFDAGPGENTTGGFGGAFTVEYLINNTPMMGMRQGTNIVIPDTEPDLAGQGMHLSELPRVGSTELWEIMVMTDETHPIHIHLIQFQVLNRQTVGAPDNADAASYHAGAYAAAFPGGTFFGVTSETSETGTPTLVDYPPGVFIPGYGPPNDYGTPNADGAIGGNPAFGPFLSGTPTPPEPYEQGWKDVFHGLDQHVNRILVRWAPVDIPLDQVKAGQNAFSFDPTTGPGYMWHCHMFEHEDNELMHGFRVVN